VTVVSGTRRPPKNVRKPLRVLALIDSLTWGGAEMLLADFAAGGPQAGIELEVAYLQAERDEPAAARLRSRGLEPVLVPIRGLLHRSARRTVRGHVAAVAPQIVHTHLQYADVLGGLAARRLGIPSVSTIHVMEPESGPREWVKEHLAASVRRRCARRVIAVSEAARQAYITASGETPARLVTVRNGIAAGSRPGVGRMARARLGLASHHLVVAMVSVLRPGKGHDVAIQAVQALRPRFPELRLLIVGDGPARAELEGLAAPLGEAAILTGHRGDVMELLDATDVLVHPSRFDAFPTVLLEAMAARVPLVSTAVGGIPEILAGGQGGTLVAPSGGAGELAEALAPLLADRDSRRRLGEAGRERFEREFTARSWAERTRAVYDAALEVPTPPWHRIRG
jgi:glycosyltransferase involved in cell wall biosynthesis